jgi:hypothetical protein
LNLKLRKVFWQHLFDWKWVNDKTNMATEALQLAHQAGAMAVLKKPYNFLDFVAIVTKALETP